MCADVSAPAAALAVPEAAFVAADHHSIVVGGDSVDVDKGTIDDILDFGKSAMDQGDTDLNKEGNLHEDDHSGEDHYTLEAQSGQRWGLTADPSPIGRAQSMTRRTTISTRRTAWA